MKRLEFPAKVALIFAGAYLSQKFVTNLWLPGPIFGAVVLVWRWAAARKIEWIRSGLFLLASTLIYALVARLILGTQTIFSDNSAVFLGTALLSAAQALFLRAPWRRAAIAVPLIFILWYSLSLTVSEIRWAKEWVINGMILWQGPYMILFFARRPLRGAPEVKPEG